MTAIAIDALHQQSFKKKRIVNQGKEPLEGYEDLVFVTKNNKPTTQFLVGECIEGIMRKIHKHNPDLIFERVTPHCFRHTILQQGGWKLIYRLKQYLRYWDILSYSLQQIYTCMLRQICCSTVWNSLNVNGM